MRQKSRFDISLRMQVYLGAGQMPGEALPEGAIQLAFETGGRGGHAIVTLGDDRDVAERAEVVFWVDREGCREVLGDAPLGLGAWHLTTEQRTIVLAILGCGLAEPACRTFRIAKSIELLCTVTVDLRADVLIPVAGPGDLSEMDTRRIVAAHRVIEERWAEQLTLDGIARSCGLSRAKLTRGFRAMFKCSVSDAIIDRRLGAARRLLQVTDLPVSSIGHRCGYSNNAAFTRAFARRFGLVPTQLRGRSAA